MRHISVIIQIFIGEAYCERTNFTKLKNHLNQENTCHLIKISRPFTCSLLYQNFIMYVTQSFVL